MVEIVNLNKARKTRARAAAKATAAANRLTHGRTKGQRQASVREQARASRLLDGARLDTNGRETDET